MALWRMKLGKEYAPEMYSDQAANSKKQEDDPKALLDGLSIASLVSLLRQFGDLSQYAAEVFHGLQEEISTTASRSRQLMSRMKSVEATLPPLEKAMLSETSHLQFVYTPGSEWHACIGDEQNHFIYTDLPHRIMDSYEDCKEPPRLQLLDKFDPGGPGSCLTRYSDPTFFRKVSTNSETLNDVKSNRVRKKRRPRKRSSCQLPYAASNLDSTDKVRSCSPPQLQQPSPPQTASTFDNAFKFDFTEKSGRDSSSFTWDGKLETTEPMILNYGMQELPSSHETGSEFGRQEIEPRMWIIGNDEVQEVHATTSVRWNSRSCQDPEAPKTNFQVEPFSGQYSQGTRNLEEPEINIQHDEQVKESEIEESETENFVDALNSIESECEKDLDCQTKAVAKDDLACEDSSLQRTCASRDTSGRELSESPECSESSTVDPWYQGNLGSLASYSSYNNGNTNFTQPTLDSGHLEIDYYNKLGLDRNMNSSVVSAHSRTQLGHQSQIDGFRRTRSMEYNEKPKEVYHEKIRDHENVTCCMTSAPASPPLDHMSISFQPTNSFETTKLKLNHPKGTDHHSETLDAFPSFQLVPEPNFQPRFNSDTDDDISHHSGPNSELWGSPPDSSENGDHIPCDAFCKTSSRGSNSSSVEHKHTTNRSIHNGSIPLPDIPLLQAMNPFVLQETHIQSYQKAPAEPFGLHELTPALPPLPPLQWRVTKPHSDALEGNESTLHLTTRMHCDVRMNAGTEPMNATLRNKQLDEQKVKVNVKNKTYQAANQRGVDEREDFLHQIRTKSFNLRKTGLLKPPSPTPVAPVANGKVAAILEKAKTIRQVMTSDDGEDDDHWSDT